MQDGENPDILAACWQIQRPIRNHGLQVESIAVGCFSEVAYLLSTGTPDLVVYMFESHTDGLVMKGKLASWNEMACTISQQPEIHHVFGIGNAERLFEYITPSGRVHIEGGDRIDLRITALYALWTTVEVLESSSSSYHNKMGENLRLWVLQDFAGNINEIICKGIAPDTATGDRVPEPIDNPALTETWMEEIPQYDETGDVLNPLMRLSSTAQDEDYIPLREMSPCSAGLGVLEMES